MNREASNHIQTIEERTEELDKTLKDGKKLYPTVTEKMYIDLIDQLEIFLPATRGFMLTNDAAMAKNKLTWAVKQWRNSERAQAHEPE